MPMGRDLVVRSDNIIKLDDSDYDPTPLSDLEIAIDILSFSFRTPITKLIEFIEPFGVGCLVHYASG